MNLYPYSNFHEINLDWIISKIVETNDKVDKFTALTKIVPRGIWSVATQYPIWSLVNNEGDGYISIQNVPSGVEITNDEYWLKVSEYSSSVADLTERLGVAENDITTLNSDITNLGGDLEDINEELGNLTEDITDNTQAINVLSARVDDIVVDAKAKKFVLISDSYGVGTTSGGTIIGWTSRFKEYMGLNNENCIISQIGGAGFEGAGYNKTFLDLLNEVDVDDTDSVTDVIIVGGYNDCWGAESPASLVNAVNTFVSACKTKFPKAELYIGATGVSQNATYTEKFANWVIPAYQSDVRAHFLSGVEYTLKTSKGSYISADNIHPTQNGYNTLAKAIVQSYLTGYVENRTNYGTVTVTNEGNAKNLTYMCDNNLMTIMINATTFNFTNITWGSWFNLGTFDNSVCGPTSSWTPSVMVGYVNVGGTFYYANCIFEISDGILYARFMPLKSDGTGYPSAVTGSAVLTGTLILPTIYV